MNTAIEMQPLFSIVVITYNSSKYVLETLESCKAQTYDNIELIITDDASTDNTVVVCREGLALNKDRFVSTELVVISSNSGIPANCNRGIKASKGEWIKIIAGDDALTDTAIEEAQNFINKGRDIEVLATQVEKFKGSFHDLNSLGVKPNYHKKAFFYLSVPNITAQIEFILSGGYYMAPGFFVKRHVFERIGYYNEKYNLLEDIPFYLKLGWNQILIHFASLVTVYYRQHDLNLTTLNMKVLQKYTFQHQSVILEYARKYGKKRFILNSYWNLLFCKLIMALGNKGKVCVTINKFRRRFQPIRIYNFWKK